jgi:NADH-quinone oxidoreductase subunit E
MVLNQQLKDAREESQRLRDKLANVKPAATPVDDLTLIRGVGEKLAAQLAKHGVTTLAEVAALDERALQDEAHCLYAYRSRIARDEWVNQARNLLTD